MRVLFITHNYIRYRGDFAGVFLHLLATKLIDSGIEVTVLAPHDQGVALEEKIEGVRIVRFRYASDDRESFAYRGDMHRRLMRPKGLFQLFTFLRAWRQRAQELMRSERFDLLVAQWALPAGWMAGRLAREYGVPFVVSSHGTDIRLLSRLWPARMAARSALVDAQKWTVVSAFLAEAAKKSLPHLSEKITVAPLPANDGVFFPAPGVERRNNHILSVTRFTQQKRVGVFIDALAELRRRGVNFSAEIVGAGPRQAEALSQIARTELEGFVTLTPPMSQEALRSKYSSAAVIALSSVDEGFGMALVEGALCGCLPVGARSGGITDIIEHEHTGLLVDPDNPQALADALMRAIRDPEMSQRIAQRARVSALERFSGDACARRYAEIFRAAIGAQDSNA